jgi:hypothetical protein
VGVTETAIEITEATPEAERKPFNVTCGKCQHSWPALYTPMEMGAASRVLKDLRCPMCGAPSKHIFMTPAAKDTP